MFLTHLQSSLIDGCPFPLALIVLYNLLEINFQEEDTRIEDQEGNIKTFYKKALSAAIQRLATLKETLQIKDWEQKGVN